MGKAWCRCSFEVPALEKRSCHPSNKIRSSNFRRLEICRPDMDMSDRVCEAAKCTVVHFDVLYVKN